MITSDDITHNKKYEIKEKDTVVFSNRMGKSRLSKKKTISEIIQAYQKMAAEYLVEKKVNAVGIDCPSIDIGVDSGLIAHKTLLSTKVLVIENLCNLYEFTNGKFTLLVTPLKLAGASGSPIRAIGIEE